MDAVVSARWLAEHLDDPGMVVLDARVVMTASGPVGDRAGYVAGHIPGAVFADLPGRLSDPAAPIGFAVPAPGLLAATLGGLGVGDGSRVVICDGRVETPAGPVASMWAARVWWMLRWLGFDDAAVLDGGLQSWEAEGRPLRAGEETNEPRVLTVRLRPELIADREAVRAAVDDPRVTLVDVLDADHFAGRRSMYARPGHITGAVNRPFADLYDEAGRFLPDRPVMQDPPPPGDRTVVYCGAGIAASAYALAMTRAGRDVAVYTASLQEWSADPALPMEPD